MNRLLIALFVLLIPPAALAGDLNPPGLPTAGSGMPTTKAIFQQLSSGQIPSAPGAFQGPAAGPGATGRSLKEIAAKLPVADNVNGATAGDVLSAKTFWGLRTDGTWGVQSGDMPNNGVANFTPGAAAVPVPAGYYSGGQVNTDAGLVSGNIKSGVSIFGVTGTAATCPGTTLCGAGTASPYCANTNTDIANCGACGNTCPSGVACSGGNCVRTCGYTEQDENAVLMCPPGKVINVVKAAFGNPGFLNCTAGTFTANSTACTASTNSLAMVINYCQGRASCSFSANTINFGDPCVGVFKRLAIVATCQ